MQITWLKYQDLEGAQKVRMTGVRICCAEMSEHFNNFNFGSAGKVWVNLDGDWRRGIARGSMYVNFCPFCGKKISVVKEVV